MRTIVLGLGNTIRGDDAVGLKVVGLVRERLGPGSPVDVVEETAGGLRLMERLAGYDRAILVDAAVTGAPAGTVRRLGPDELPTQRTAYAHGVDLTTALGLGREMGLPMPGEVRIVAVEAESVFDFRSELSPPVAAAVEGAVEAVLAELAVTPPKEAT